MPLADFQILEKLGERKHSSVYKVKRINNNTCYALKKVLMANLSSKDKQNALTEVQVLASIRSKNVIAYKEAFIDEATQSLW